MMVAQLFLFHRPILCPNRGPHRPVKTIIICHDPKLHTVHNVLSIYGVNVSNNQHQLYQHWLRDTPYTSTCVYACFYVFVCV